MLTGMAGSKRTMQQTLRMTTTHRNDEPVSRCFCSQTDTVWSSGTIANVLVGRVTVRSRGCRCRPMCRPTDLLNYFQLSCGSTPMELQCPFLNHAKEPGNEALATKGTMGRQEKNKHGEHRWSSRLRLLHWVSFGDLQCCGSATLSPTARIHNGSKFGRKSAGSSVSTDRTRCTFEVECSRWGPFIRSDCRISSFVIILDDMYSAQRSLVVFASVGNGLMLGPVSEPRY